MPGCVRCLHSLRWTLAHTIRCATLPPFIDADSMEGDSYFPLPYGETE